MLRARGSTVCDISRRHSTTCHVQYSTLQDILQDGNTAQKCAKTLDFCRFRQSYYHFFFFLSETGNQTAKKTSRTEQNRYFVQSTRSDIIGQDLTLIDRRHEVKPTGFTEIKAVPTLPRFAIRLGRGPPPGVLCRRLWVGGPLPAPGCSAPRWGKVISLGRCSRAPALLPHPMLHRSGYS